MDKHFIYGLTAEGDDTVRYIGRTQQPKHRLYQHLHEFNTSHGVSRREWIRELAAKGQRPRMIIIEECTSDNVQERERYWICHYSSIHSLLNDKVPYSTGGNTDNSYMINSQLLEARPDDVMTIADAAKYLAVTGQTVAYYLDRKQLTTVLVSGKQTARRKPRRAVLKSEIEALKQKFTTTTAQEPPPHA